MVNKIRSPSLKTFPVKKFLKKKTEKNEKCVVFV